MHVIVDADPIVYRSGFAAETHNYNVDYEDADGELQTKFFDKSEDGNAGDKKKAFFKANPSFVILESSMVPDVEPVAFALQGVKITIEAIFRDAERHMGMPITQKTVLLSGPNNFRITTATIKKYKGNRDDTYKPVHYQAIRDYLHTRWDARVIEGHEADDECSILAWMDYRAGADCIVCTIDKDLDQIPVPHFDYAKKVYYTVDEEEGVSLFERQILSGDSTDNIQGLFRVGDKAATKMLDSWVAEFITDAATDLSWVEYFWDKTVEAYKANIAKYPEKYPSTWELLGHGENIMTFGTREALNEFMEADGIEDCAIVTKDNPKGFYHIVEHHMSAEAAALENARLVFMQHYRGQYWTPPGQPDGETT